MAGPPVEDPRGWRLRGRELRRLLLTASIALVIALFFVDEDEWSIDPPAVARVESLPAEVLETDDLEVASALARYRRGDFAGALLELANLRLERPRDVDLMLYEGSGLLLVGETRAARDVLRAGVEALAMGSPARHPDELRFQLAQAHLELGDWRDAVALLEPLSEGSSARRRAAEEQLAEL